ncbi:MAG: hypothetical protein CMN77_03970 [Spirochaetaceae bacterium]|nr:hypothetical protein [Spirochaetaceae bacterium]|tara:strand:+ start:161898 stop:165101 length:3204 start_codon:yes stop_codon:yes gene_type:complete
MAEPDTNPTLKAGNPGFNEILGSLLILFGLLLSLAVISYDNQAAMGLKPGTVENWTGTVGHYGAMLLFILFGKASYILGPLMVYMGIRGLVQSRSEDYVPGLLGSLTMVTALSLFFHFYTPMTYSDVQGTDPISGGGALGYRVGELLRFLFGTYGAFLVALGILVPGFLYTFRLPFPEFLNLTRNRLDRMKRGGQTGFHRLLYVLFPPPQQKEEILQEPADPEVGVTTGEAALKDWSEMAGHVRKEAKPGMTYQDYSNQDDVMKEPFWEKKEQNGKRPWIEKRVVESEDAPHRPSTWKPAASGRYHSGMDPMKQSVLEMENQREVFGRHGAGGGGYGAGPDGYHDPHRAEEDLPYARNLDLESELEELHDVSDDRGEPGNPIPGYFDRSGRSFHFQRKRSTPYRKQEDGFLGVLELEPGLRRGRDDRPEHPATGFSDTHAKAESKPFESQARFISPASVLDLDRNDLVGPETDHLAENDSIAAADQLDDAGQGAYALAADKYPTENAMIEDATEETRFAAYTDSEEGAQAESRSALYLDDESEDLEMDSSDLDAAREQDEEETSGSQIPRPPVSARKSANDGISTSIYEPDSETLVPPITGLKGYKLPLSILQFSRRPERNDVAREIEGVKEQLEAVMRDYGIQASVVHATRGPMITQYEVRPEPGVRVNRLLRIQDEIRMHLAAHSVRIVAPIPGKSTIGIELPNSVRETVTLGDLARKDENFFARHRELGIALGKDIAGSNLYVDLARLPHLLIAGATGSGKSVYMNSVIASILYNRSPEEVRFLMVDPKMVELKLYEGIPHLLYPVITDVRKASRALQWAVQEMERRYQILSKRKVRDIRSFNEKVKEGRIEHDPMPYVVVLIDELSDLMMVSAKDVEDSIIRLTQKARAVGIHLIMATQRPSVDVITALIKANCPARIAFQVAQKTDSRVILDSNGAESLLGRGDMLYKSPTAAAPVRIQSPMVSEEEIEDIVREARKHGSPNFVELPGEDMEAEGAAEDVDSELLSEAWKIILESGKTSTSYVQRRLRIGYNRAANLIENLEQMGYLGPAIGNRPREILKRD